MIKYHFRPEKKLSQFFCINEALLLFLQKSANLKKDDIVLEVGPGTGFLTRVLLEKSHVVAVEKDEIMIDLLKVKFEKEIEAGKLILVHGSIIDQDLDKLKVNKIVSLPPYHLSSDLVNQLTLSKIKKAILVLDTGFVEKLTAFEGLSEYTALSAFVNLNSKVNVLERISKTSFFPKPNCQSAVIEIDFDRKEKSKDFFVFVKELFRHKNKDLSRAIKQTNPFLKNKLKKEINPEKISQKMLGEKVYSFSPKKLLEIYKTIK